MDFSPLIEKIKQSETFAVYGHINPDGDSAGAILSMLHILKNHFGKEKATGYSRDAFPKFLEFLPGADGIVSGKPAENDAPDLAILVDCGSAKRIGDELAAHLNSAKCIAVIDHHATNSGFGDFNYTNPGASSTCEVICRFAEAAGVDIDKQLASFLYTGIMYDTGRFIHSNTTPEVFRDCSMLVAKGAEPANIAEQVFNRRSISHLKLLGFALNNFQTEENGAIAYMAVRDADMKKLGAAQEDNEGVVEAMGGYDECEVHILFTELPDGKVRVSMRSKGRVVVGKICEKFGGGGHDFAAGIRFVEPIEDVVKKVVEETRVHLRSIHGS